MGSKFTVSAVLPASPQEVYDAWLDSKEHSAMTGGTARISARVGTDFEAWDGYIQGRNLELEVGRRIVQSWRTSEFAQDQEDSRVEITLQPTDQGTRLTLVHSNLPENQKEQYRQGWRDNYFQPMKQYFRRPEQS